MKIPTNNKTQRELEADISQGIIRFEKEVMGRGPLEIKTYLLDDMVVIRLKGVLTQAEIKLAKATDRRRGRYLLKQVRQELIDQGRPILASIVRDVLGAEIQCLHTDISTRTGERVIVLTLEEKLSCIDRSRPLEIEHANRDRSPPAEP